MNYYIDYFGQAYGEGNYGSGVYSCTVQQEQDGICTVGTADNNGSGSNGGLSNTGMGIIAIITIACLLIFVALLVRVWRRKPAPQPVAVAAEQSDDPVTRQ